MEGARARGAKRSARGKQAVYAAQRPLRRRARRYGSHVGRPMNAGLLDDAATRDSAAHTRVRGQFTRPSGAPFEELVAAMSSDGEAATRPCALAAALLPCDLSKKTVPVWLVRPFLPGTLPGLGRTRGHHSRVQRGPVGCGRVASRGE